MRPNSESAHQVTFEISSSSSVTNVGIEDGLIRATCHRVTVIPSGREFFVCVDETATDHISASIRELKFQLPEHYHLVSRLMPAGSRVVDLGAHIGTFSLFCGALGFDVLAVEASPRNAALLKTSAEMSGFQNIEVVQSAVGETSGFITFLEAGPYGYVRGGSNDASASEADIAVRKQTLPQILSDLGWSGINFVKMDVEGSEIAALRGMASILRRDSAPVIITESNAHTLGFFGATPRNLLSLLESFGYQCYLVDGNRLVSWKSSSLQPIVVQDYVAVKSTPSGFSSLNIVDHLTQDEWIAKAVAAAQDQNPLCRSHAGKTLAWAADSIKNDPRVVGCLRQMLNDDDPQVRTSVSWWSQR